MAKCKHCSAEIKEMLDICPSCGKNPGIETITSIIKKAEKGSSRKGYSKKQKKKPE